MNLEQNKFKTIAIGTRVTAIQKIIFRNKIINKG